MDLNAIMAALAAHILPGFVAMEKLTRPGVTNAELVQIVDGDLKHYMRAKIGWAVDIIWGLTQFRSMLDAAIQQAVNNAPSLSFGSIGSLGSSDAVAGSDPAA